MKTWSLIIDKLKEDTAVVLVVVIDNQGSSPGRKGFKMIVTEDGRLLGSVGGGSMEQRMVMQAKKMISEHSTRVLVKQQEHHSDAPEDKSGMICSGNQTIAFFPLIKGRADVAEAIVKYLADGGAGIVSYSPTGISLRKNQRQKERFQSEVISDNEWELREQIGLPDTLYLFGAGHVSLALSRVCALLDFEIELFDNRKGLSTFIDNRYVTKKQIVDFRDIEKLVQEGDNSYVVIMSYSHQYDESLLSQLLNKKLRYLGMMGSKNKVRTIKNHLAASGFTEEQLSAVYAPIGLSINSQTPMEIAISVVAQIISVRNGNSII